MQTLENEKRRIKDRRLLQEYPDHALNTKLGKYQKVKKSFDEELDSLIF